MNLLPIDELNRIDLDLKTAEITGEKKPVEEILDDVLDFLLFVYFTGSRDAAEALGIQVEPSIEDAREALNLKVAGKTYKERIREYSEGISEDGVSPTDEIIRVIDTDMTRIYNTAVLDTGIANGATRKTWQTMEDERVRDPHRILQGVTVPIDGEFYTDGDHAPQPGMFTKAALNVNCRCYLTVS